MGIVVQCEETLWKEVGYKELHPESYVFYCSNEISKLLACTIRKLNFPSSGLVHPNITCDSCGQDIEVMGGMRWKCAKCYDYDLCNPCYMAGNHSLEHPFVRFDTRSMR